MNFSIKIIRFGEQLSVTERQHHTLNDDLLKRVSKGKLEIKIIHLAVYRVDKILVCSEMREESNYSPGQGRLRLHAQGPGSALQQGNYGSCGVGVPKLLPVKAESFAKALRVSAQAVWG